MKIQKFIVFLFQSITIGLALAFLVVVWYPELLDNGKNVVAFVESNVPKVQNSRTGPVSYAAAVEIAAPAVVNIHTRKTVIQSSPLFDDPFFRRFFGEQFGINPRKREETSLGSGVIVNDQGYILTNNHVIEGADEVRVSLRDGRSAAAVVVGTDREADLAVLKIDLGDLPVITLGDSESLRVGDVVLAIGNPFGVGQTVTMGIVSATGRNRIGLNTFENFIQTDAAINPGNSGGALVNARGELIGINTAIFSQTVGAQGIGFAIPISLALDIMQQIIEFGEVTRGWLGVEGTELSARAAQATGDPGIKGALIVGVFLNSPADMAGIRAGDIVVGIDGNPVSGIRDLLDQITRHKPGEQIQVTIYRGTQKLDLDMKVTQRPQ